MPRAATAYNDAFYDDVSFHSNRSAAVVVPLVMSLLNPRSVVDVGCGAGAWLKQFHLAGVPRVKGIDGPWVEKERFALPAENFTAMQIDENLSIKESYDLAVSLETLEHIHANKVDAVLKALTQAAPVLLFSAAVTKQGGVGHVNEQWPSYWVKKFSALHYRVFDIIRPQIWANSDVSFWFAQNTLLFVRESHLKENALLEKRLLSHPSFNGLNMIHPGLYASVLERLTCLESLGGALKQVIKKGMRR